MKPVASAVGMIAIVAALSACATPEPTYIAVQTGPMPAAMAGVGIETVLGLSDDGCWGAGQSDIVFPLGTTIQPDGSGIVLPEGFEVDLGERLTGAGITVEDYTEPVPSQCDREDVTVLWYVDRP